MILSKIELNLSKNIFSWFFENDELLRYQANVNRTIKFWHSRFQGQSHKCWIFVMTRWNKKRLIGEFRSRGYRWWASTWVGKVALCIIKNLVAYRRTSLNHDFKDVSCHCPEIICEQGDFKDRSSLSLWSLVHLFLFWINEFGVEIRDVVTIYVVPLKSCGPMWSSCGPPIASQLDVQNVVVRSWIT